MEEPLKLGIFILLLVPGFIFVQILEFHLLREKRSQFEKSLEIVLYGALIWIIASASPLWWPLSSSRGLALAEALAVFQYSSPGANSDWLTLLTSDSIRFFLTVCFWSFVFAHLWGVFRKDPRVDARIRWWTGRDWYPSVALKFFDQNLSRTVIVATPQNRYWGTLFSAPDRKEDPYIILSDVSRLPDPGSISKEIEQLPLVRWVLIKFDDIIEIQALTDQASEKKPIERNQLWQRIKNVWTSH